MDSVLFIAAAILLAVIGFGIYRASRPMPTAEEEDRLLHYTQGLNSLLAGNKPVALQHFREAVRKDTSNIDAYIKIGDLYRELGQVEKAVNVHRTLTVRSDLKPSERLEILKSLALDYYQAQRPDQALKITEQILQLDKNNVWARELQVQLYEKREAWEQAFETLRELTKLKGEKRDGMLALYKVQEGLRLIRSGSEKEGRICFREAIKLDPTCTPAYLYLGDSYLREERHEDALEVLKNFIEKVPHQSYLAFERMKEALFQIRRFDQIQDYYISILERHPEVTEARFALAEIYEKKGELWKAIDLCQELLEKDPKSRMARQYLVRFFHKAGNDRKAIEEALKIFEEDWERQASFTCKNCGYASKEPFWRCPQCDAWNTSDRNSNKRQ